MDIRELILLRVIEVYGAIAGMSGNVFRDRGDLPGAKLPAGVVLDGTERAVSKVKSGRGPMTTAPLIMELSPELYWVMDPLPVNRAAEYGPLLTSWRNKIVKAILLDATLTNLVGPNGDIEYKGFDTDMQSGRNMEGQLQFFFTFRYVFKPLDL